MYVIDTTTWEKKVDHDVLRNKEIKKERKKERRNERHGRRKEK